VLQPRTQNPAIMPSSSGDAPARRGRWLLPFARPRGGNELVAYEVKRPFVLGSDDRALAEGAIVWFDGATLRVGRAAFAFPQFATLVAVGWFAAVS
jgi:hypothetical protein